MHHFSWLYLRLRGVRRRPEHEVQRVELPALARADLEVEVRAQHLISDVGPGGNSDMQREKKRRERERERENNLTKFNKFDQIR